MEVPWQCPRCTLHNSPGSTTCAACTGVRPPPSLPSSSPVNLPDGATPDPAAASLSPLQDYGSDAPPALLPGPGPLLYAPTGQHAEEMPPLLPPLLPPRNAAAAGGGGAAAPRDPAAADYPRFGFFNAEPPEVEIPGVQPVESPNAANARNREIHAEFRNFVFRGKHYVPFIVLLIILFAFHHILGLLLWCSFANILRVLSAKVKEEVSQRDNARASVLWVYALVCSFLTAFVFKLCEDDHLTDLWMLKFPTSATQVGFWDILWRLSMNDFAVRFGALAFNSFVASGSFMWLCRMGTDPEPTQFRVKRRLFATVETVSLLLRTILVTPVWMMFYQFERGAGPSLSDPKEFTFTYAIVKFVVVVLLLRVLARQIAVLINVNLPYGTFMTAAQVSAAENQSCSICLNDLQCAVQLPCGHHYCRTCIEEWLDRERLCPLCRATVPGAGGYEGGDGSVSQLPIIL